MKHIAELSKRTNITDELFLSLSDDHLYKGTALGSHAPPGSEQQSQPPYSGWICHCS